MRVQQTIRSQESSIVSYKIANLLQFYLMTMRRTVGDDALLSTTLKEYVSPRNRELVFVFVFLLNYLPGLLTWHTSYSMNQLKLEVMPFLAYLWSVATCRWYLLYFLFASKQDQDDRSVKPPLTILDHAQSSAK
jgi:Conserved oligomeric complex COG6